MPGTILRAVTWPLLFLLHLAFTLFSLLLRITESFSHCETVSRAPSIPHHVALCLPSRQTSRRRRVRYTAARGSEQERRALVETLKRTVRWAVQDGIRELSVYSDIGWEGVPQELQRLISTTSTSSSRTSSTQSSSPARISTPPDSLSSISLPPDERPDTIHTEGDPDSEASEASSPTPKSRSRSGMRNRQVLKKAPASPYTTLVLGDSRHGTVKLHLLPDLDMASVASRYAQSGTPPSQLTVQSVDTDIRNLLGMENDPELLIIHPLTPLSPLHSLLPRPAPELSSYPFWHLRITEIHQTPQLLPMVSLLAPLVQRLRTSTMPALVKIGYAMPLVTPNRVRGALRREEWDGGLAALGKVEQRLGK